MCDSVIFLFTQWRKKIIDYVVIHFHSRKKKLNLTKPF